MRLGDIKIEALKLMFANGCEDIGIEQLEELAQGEEYGDYLIAMNGSINRCFSDLECRGVLPVKSFLLQGGGGNEGEPSCFELEELIDDYGSVERLLYECEGKRYEEQDVDSYLLGSTLLLPWHDGKRERYRVLYRPRLSRLLSYTPNDTELALPEHIAAAIPYWIKGELYRGDEVNEAGEARNWYEAALRQAERTGGRRQGRSKSVYSQVWS